MQYRKQEENRIKMINMFSAMIVVIFILFSILMMRLAYVQLVQGKVYATQAHSIEWTGQHQNQQPD